MAFALDEQLDSFTSAPAEHYGLSAEDVADLRFYWLESESAAGLSSKHGAVIDRISKLVPRRTDAVHTSPVEALLMAGSLVTTRTRHVRSILECMRKQGHGWAADVLYAAHGEPLPGLVVQELGELSAVARACPLVLETRETLVRAKAEELMALARAQDSARLTRCTRRAAEIPTEIAESEERLAALNDEGPSARRTGAWFRELYVARHLREELASLPLHPLSPSIWERIERAIRRDAESSVTPQMALAVLVRGGTDGQAKANVKANCAQLRREAAELLREAAVLYRNAARAVAS